MTREVRSILPGLVHNNYITKSQLLLSQLYCLCDNDASVNPSQLTVSSLIEKSEAFSKTCPCANVRVCKTTSQDCNFQFHRCFGITDSHLNSCRLPGVLRDCIEVLGKP